MKRGKRITIITDEETVRRFRMFVLSMGFRTYGDALRYLIERCAVSEGEKGDAIKLP